MEFISLHKRQILSFTLIILLLTFSKIAKCQSTTVSSNAVTEALNVSSETDNSSNVAKNLTILTSTPPTKNKPNISVTSTTKLPKTTKIPQIKRFKRPSLEIALLKQTLWLNTTAQEDSIELTIITSQKSPIDGNVLSKSHQLLVGFETSHFNVDVVLLPFIETDAKEIGFGNQIKDFAWNKRNGILLPDVRQNYKWLASGKNATHFFITFQRNWMTCEKADVQFGQSPMKIWWLLENTEKGSLVNSNQRANNKMVKFEKQQQLTTESSQTFTTNIPLQITPISENLNTSKTVSTATPKTSATTTEEIVRDVEILKSIQESNFKGPFYFPLDFLVDKEVSVYLKACEESNVMFHCSGSDVGKFFAGNNTDILAIWKILMPNSSLKRKFPEHRIESCKVAIEFATVGNMKSFNALFGSHKNLAVEHFHTGSFWFWYILLAVLLCRNF